MAHHSEEPLPNKEERMYTDFMMHGDDFDKIEIYRAAKKWYLKALDLNIHNAEVQQKIDTCNTNIKSEIGTINIIAILSVLIAIGILLFTGS
jgi:hypothetical protein